jgi:predicted trehalose synthase
LPRSVDGRHALASLLARGTEAEPAETPSLTARMGRITAALHVALSTPSSVLPEPTTAATTTELARWHERIRSAIDRAALIAAEGTVPGAGQQFLSRLGRLESDADGLAAAVDSAQDVALQRVHGDLHTGRILRWAGGLAVTGFGDEPEGDPAFLAPQPPARDLARLLQSLEQVARDVDEQNEDERCASDWLPGARRRVIAAYRTELRVARRDELFDERLLAAFEAEHAARQVIETAQRQAAARSLQGLDAVGQPIWEKRPDHD